MRALLRAVLLLLLSALALFVVLPFSEAGSRWFLNMAQRLAPVEIDYRSGTIASRLEISRLGYVKEGLRVELLDVQSQLDLACVWRSVICVAQLDVAELSVDVGSVQAGIGGGVADSPETPGDAATWAFPLLVELSIVNVARSLITWPGGEWRQASAGLRHVTVNGSGIVVDEADFQRPELELFAVEDDAEKPVARVRLPEIRLPFTLSVGGLSLMDPAWIVSGSKVEHEQLFLSAEWQDSALLVNELGVWSRDLGELALSGEVDFSGDWPLQVTGSVEVSDQALDYEIPMGELEFEVVGNMADVSLTLAGRAGGDVVLDARADLLEPGLPFELEVRVVEGEPLPISGVFGLPEDLTDLTLEFPWYIKADGSLERQKFEMDGRLSGLGYKNVQLVASGDREGPSIQLQEISLVDEQGDNRVAAAGELLLRDEFALRLGIETPGVSLPESLAPAEGRLSGEFLADTRFGRELWQVRLTQIALQGEVNGQAAGATGQFFLNQDWSLGDSDLQVALNGADLRLFGSAEGSREGRMEIAVEDIGRWRADVRGALHGRAVLRPLVGAIEFEAVLADFDWGQFEATQTVVRGEYALDDSRFHLSLSSGTANLGGAKISDLMLAASGDQQRQTVQILSGGDVRGEIRLDGRGWGETWTGTIRPASFETAHGSWNMEPAIKLEWLSGPGQLLASAHCWRTTSASVCFDDLRLGSSGALQLEAKGELADLESFLPPSMELGGSTEVSLAGRWQEDGEILFEGATRTRSVIVTRRYGEGESASVTWDKGEGRLLFDGSVISVDWSLQRENSRILDLELKLPVAEEDPLDGRVAVSRLELEPLIAFAPSLARLGGEVTGQLAISGTRGNPLAHGKLRLSNGVAALAGNPTVLEDLQISLDVDGAIAIVDGAGLLGGGQVKLDGELALQPAWKLQLRIEGERQRVLYPPATELLLSERLTLSASSELLALEGTITVHEGTLEPEQLPEGSIAVSPHIVEVDYRGDVIRKQLPFDLSLNVRIVVENRFEVRTSVLFATLGGELELVQRPSQPLQLFGSMRVVDGYVSAYKQKLQIQRGVFSFTGRPDNPSVNVRAVRNVSGSNIVVGMQVQGTYEALSMDVFSEPGMSDGEAMSYLIRGRGLDSSAGEDGTALALSVAGGVVNRSTLVSELNRIPGVRDVSFGAEGTSEDTAATVSGFVGDRIFLAYGIGVYEPINVLIARFYLRTRLWLEVVSRLENSADLYYAFDID